MPELPEVETVRNGLANIIVGTEVATVHIHQPRLRYPVPKELPQLLAGSSATALERRAKYLLWSFGAGTVLFHLGMSGRLCWQERVATPGKHDHVDFVFSDGSCLRFNDPRRFGLVLWHPGDDPQRHRLLRRLGPEPLGADFSAAYLFEVSRNSRRAIKTFLMDSHIVVGVGNIYANEALFKAGIHPRSRAGQLSLQQCGQLVAIIQQVLCAAIAAGGTTLQDFVNGHGDPGYFQQQLFVYGRTGQPCLRCGTTLQCERIGQRSAFFCPCCQRLL